MGVQQYDYETGSHDASHDGVKTDSSSAGHSGATSASHDSGVTLDHHSAGDAASNVTQSSCALLNSSDVLCYASFDESTNIDEPVVDFLLSIFWVLESKRRDRSCEHVDNLTLLTAPFEHRKDSSITDLDGRLFNDFYLYILCILTI